MQDYVIAIDGPAGAGKSSIAKAVAQRLGIQYIDTGAMYRAVAFKALQEGVELQDGAALAQMLKTTQIALRYDEQGNQRLILDGSDVSGAIRENRVSVAASDVSAHAQVREALVAMQRDIGRKGGVVMDGRDIGTVVLPDARHKFFITANIQARALRRYHELKAAGALNHQSIDQIERGILARDEADSNREASPLSCAKDARCIDTSELSLQEAVKKVLDYIGQNNAKVSGE